MKNKELVVTESNKLNMGFQNNSSNQNINVNLFNIQNNENHMNKNHKVTKKSSSKKTKDTPQNKLHSQTLKLAWGNLDKNKIINLYEGIMQEYQKKSVQKSPIYKDDKLRREQLGLKNLPQSKIKSKKAVSNQQISNSKKAKIQQTQSKDLHQYMIKKKKNIENLKQTSQKINSQKKIAIDKNLKQLYQRQSELIQKSPKNEIKLANSYQNYYTKPQSPQNQISPNKSGNKSPVAKQASFNPSKTNQDIIQKSFNSTDQHSFQSINLENLKKNQNLVEQNNIIKCQSMNDQSPINKSQKKQSKQISPKQKSPISKKNQRSPNNKQSNSTGYDLNRSNNNYNRIESGLTNQRSQQANMRNDSFKQNIEKQVIKQQQISNDSQYKKYNQNLDLFEDIGNQIEKILIQSIDDIIEQVINQNQQESKGDIPNEEEQLKILNQVAVIIQKNWKGFHTRKLLREYFEELYQEQQQNFHQQNMVGLNKSQQYLYQQTSQNLIIFEDEKEDQSETNTNISKIKKIQNQQDEDEDKNFRNSIELPNDQLQRITGSNKLHSLHEKHKHEIKIQHESLILNGNQQDDNKKLIENQENKRIQQLNYIQNIINQQLVQKDDEFLSNLVQIIDVLKSEDDDVQLSVIESNKIDNDICINQVLSYNFDILLKKIIENNTNEIKQQFENKKIQIKQQKNQQQENLQLLQLGLQAANKQFKEIENYNNDFKFNEIQDFQDNQQIQIDQISEQILYDLINEFECNRLFYVKLQNIIMMPNISINSFNNLLNKLTLIFQDYYNDLKNQYDNEELKILYLHNSEDKIVTPQKIISQLVKNKLSISLNKNRNYWLILNMIDLTIQQLQINIPYENQQNQIIDFNKTYQLLKNIQNQVIELSNHYINKNHSIQINYKQSQSQVEQISDLIYQDLIYEQIYYSIKIHKASTIYNQILNQVIQKEIKM